MSASFHTRLSLRTSLLAASALSVLSLSPALADEVQDTPVRFDLGQSIDFGARAEPFSPTGIVLRSLSTQAGPVPANPRDRVIDTPQTLSSLGVGSGTTLIDNVEVIVQGGVGISASIPGEAAILHVRGENARLEANQISALENEIGAQILRISDGATVSTNTFLTGTSLLGGTPQILIGGEDNGVISAPGFLDAGQILTGDLGVRVIFNHSGDDYTFDTPINGVRNQSFVANNGTTTLARRYSFIDSVTVTGGKLINDASLNTDSLVVSGGEFEARDELVVSRTLSISGPGEGGTLTLNAGGSLERSRLSNSLDFALLGRRSGETGTLRLANGGRFELGRITLGAVSGSTGRLVFGGEIDGEIATVGNLGTATISVGPGRGEIVFNHANTGYIFNADITFGAPDFVIMNGRTSFGRDYTASDVTISGGTLLIGQTLTADQIIMTGGELGGLGQINADLIVGSGAQITPGSASGQGTLSITGDVTFEAGSILDTVVRAPDDLNLLAIDGSLQINGGEVRVEGFDAILDPITFDIDLITATGGVTGAFDTLDANFAFYTSSLVYESNAVVLRLIRNQAEFADFADTPNQLGVAEALEALDITDPLVTAALTLSEGAVPGVFNSLTGEVHGSVRGSAFRASDFFADALSNRTEPTEGSGFSVWVQVAGEDARLGADLVAAALTRESRGGAAGGDFALGSFRIGVGGSVQSSDLDVIERQSTGEMESWQLGVYAFGTAGPVELSASASSLNHEVTTARTTTLPGFGQTLTASYDITGSQIAAEARLQVLDFISPFAGLRLTQLDGDAFSETGSAAALDVSGFSDELTRIELGVEVDAGVLGADGLTGAISWRSNSGGDESALTALFAGETLNIQGARIDDSAIALDIGYALDIAEMISISAGYAGEYGDNTNRHGLRLTARASF